MSVHLASVKHVHFLRALSSSQTPRQFARCRLCPEMHLALNLVTSCKTGLFVISYDFMFDRNICVSV